PGDALAVVALAGAEPDQVGVALGHGDRAHRHQAVVLELGGEGGAAVGGHPEAAVGGGDEEVGRVGLLGGEVGDASGHGGRADGAEVEALELLGDGDGRRGVLDILGRGGGGEERGGQERGGLRG